MYIYIFFIKKKNKGKRGSFKQIRGEKEEEKNKVAE